MSGRSDGDRTRRFGLLARSTVAFGALALLLAASLALFSYELTRRYLIDQRVTGAQRQAYQNARTLRDALAVSGTGTAEALSLLQTSTSGAAVVELRGSWFGTAAGFGQASLPASLLELTDDGSVGHQRTEVGGSPFVVIGVPVPASGLRYFELVPLTELERTLGALSTALVLAAAVTTTVAAVIGRYASRRVLRPLNEIAGAAGSIGEGSLIRLPSSGDPDLDPLITSFNGMVGALQTRIDRERRFASDVSHELRTPLAAMSASLNVAHRQTDNPSALHALSELERQVSSFTTLVLDLLEISRLEAGVATMEAELVDLVSLAKAVLEATGHTHVALVAPDEPVAAFVDKRRIGQVLTNFITNADRYGGGPTAMIVERGGETARIIVDDDGPGVPLHERSYVFERFARGEATTDPAAPGGTGLGLALVAEHVRLHGGRVWVDEAPSGGARFVVELPEAQP